MKQRATRLSWRRATETIDGTVGETIDDTVDGERSMGDTRHGNISAMPTCWRARSVLVALAIASGAVATPVHAESKVSFLAEQLRKNADFRVRTSAAIALGNSNEDPAVKPLCECLGDSAEVETVRIACAAGLGKLKKSGSRECLQGYTSDTSPKVKEQVGASLKALGSPAGPTTCASAPPAGSKPKYLVGVQISNKSTRPDAEVRAIVAKELNCKLASLGRFRLAPDDEVDAKKMDVVVKRDKLDGYFLSVTLEPIKYDGGSLKIAMKLVIMTHSRDLQGEVGKSLAMTGVTSPSKRDEDDMIGTASEKLANDFAGLKP